MIKFLLRLFLSLFFFLFSQLSLSDETPEDTLIMMEKVTPSFQIPKLYGAMKHSPENPTNNLRRAAGSPYFAKGTPLTVNGRVFDITGKPIVNVAIKIVQANYFGSYNFIVDSDSAVYDRNFLSSGTSITNNLGEYYFLTIMPGYYGNRAPHLHFTISHRDFEIETEMFFSNHPRNESDAKYIVLSQNHKKALTGMVSYQNSKNFKEGMKVEFDIYVNYNINI